MLMQRAREKKRARKMKAATQTDTAASDTAASDTAAPTLTAASDDVVAIMNAWIREAHPEAATNAGYMTLVNSGTEELTLTHLDSPAFDKVELHEMTMHSGLMKMRQLAEMVVPAGGLVRFAPGGRHLMLHGPHQHLEAGQTVELILTFRCGRKQRVTVKVATP